MPDQTKPNQTSQSGILHFVKHSVRAYQKKFQLSRSNGSWDTGSGKFKIWKMSNLGFFEKWPPEAPKKGKNQFWWVPWWFWTPMLHQKKFRPFSGPGVIKRVHAHWTAPVTEIDKMTEWIKLSLCFAVIQCFHIHMQLEIYMIINWFSEFKQDLIFVFAHDNMKNEYKSLLNRSRWIWMHVSKMN